MPRWSPRDHTGPTHMVRTARPSSQQRTSSARELSTWAGGQVQGGDLLLIHTQSVADQPDPAHQRGMSFKAILRCSDRKVEESACNPSGESDPQVCWRAQISTDWWHQQDIRKVELLPVYSQRRDHSGVSYSERASFSITDQVSASLCNSCHKNQAENWWVRQDQFLNAMRLGKDHQGTTAEIQSGDSMVSRVNTDPYFAKGQWIEGSSQ